MVDCFFQLAFGHGGSFRRVVPVDRNQTGAPLAFVGVNINRCFLKNKLLNSRKSDRVRQVAVADGAWNDPEFEAMKN